jgi:NAD(P)H-hydrate repair Nnr-like enzyme with NAD(P)H-hydrate epimerase domain
VNFMGLSGISKDQMEEVDRLMIEEYNIPFELMMEHAGLYLARLSYQFTRSSQCAFYVHIVLK